MTQNFEDVAELYKKQATTGRLFYFCAAFLSAALMFTSVSSPNFMMVITAFVFASIYAAILQVRNYVFHCSWIGGIYRTFLIVANFAMFLTLFNSIKAEGKLGDYLCYLEAFGFTCGMSLFMGAFVSVPFKLISLVLGYFPSITDIYDDEASIPDNLSSTKPLKTDMSEYRYAGMNETELRIALSNAINEEDYTAAEKITKELEKK